MKARVLRVVAVVALSAAAGAFGTLGAGAATAKKAPKKHHAKPLVEQQLAVAPVKSLDPSAYRPGPFPKKKIPAIAKSVLHQPVSVRVHDLLFSSTKLRPNEEVVVVAGDLETTKPHAVLFELDGPRYLGVRLVAETHGVAAARVTLPKRMRPGRWVFSVQDVSDITAATGDTVTGQAVMDLSVFLVRHHRA